MLQRIHWRWLWLCFWLWPKGPPFEERKNIVWNQERIKGIFAWKECKRKERAKGCRLRKDTKRVCARAKKEEVVQEKKERTAKSEPFREKKIVKRELCVENKIERKVQSVAAFERDNLCVWEQRKTRVIFSLVVRHI